MLEKILFLRHLKTYTSPIHGTVSISCFSFLHGSLRTALSVHTYLRIRRLCQPLLRFWSLLVTFRTVIKTFHVYSGCAPCSVFQYRLFSLSMNTAAGSVLAIFSSAIRAKNNNFARPSGPLPSGCGSFTPRNAEEAPLASW